MTAGLIRGNALHLPLRDESVDVVCTSPPYFALRSYQDGGEHYRSQIGSEPTPQDFLEALWAATREMVRVLKPSGSIWVNLGDKYAGSNGQSGGTGAASLIHGVGNQANQPTHLRRGYVPQTGIRAKSLMGLPWRYAIGCIDSLGLILRAEVIWDKPNGLPESVTDRVRRSHEQWFHFTREGRYFAAVDEIREPATTTPNNHAKHSTKRQGLTDGTRGTLPYQYDAPNPLGKLPGSVWTVPSEPLRVPDWLGVDHFAAFPQEWPRRIILGWSPSGVCVECGEGRRPTVDVDWAQIPHQMVERRAITPAQSAEWCADFAGWCSERGITRAALDDAAGTSDMGGWWASTLPHRSQVPTPEQWQKLRSRFDPPSRFDSLVHSLSLVPVAEWETPDTTIAGRHRTSKPANLSAGDYRTITGYVCACPTPDAPTTPAVVLDPFVGTGTVPLVARALGRTGIGVDLSADYLRLARWRTTNPASAAKSVARTNASQQGTLL